LSKILLLITIILLLLTNPNLTAHSYFYFSRHAQSVCPVLVISDRSDGTVRRLAGGIGLHCEYFRTLFYSLA